MMKETMIFGCKLLGRLSTYFDPIKNAYHSVLNCEWHSLHFSVLLIDTQHADLNYVKNS